MKIKNIIIAICLIASLAASAQQVAVNNVSVNLGAESTITVKLTGSSDCIAAGFILELPEELLSANYTLQLDKNFVEDHVAVTEHPSNKNLKVAIYSTTNSPFKGGNSSSNSTLLKLNFKALDITPGTYQCKVKNIELVNSNHELKRLSNINFTIVVSAVVGDVNCDGHVSSVDITALYNYLLNGDDSNLLNGDVDGDGHISAVDVTAIYNILIGYDDNGGGNTSNSEIVIERKYKVHHAYNIDWYGDYFCYSNITLQFDTNDSGITVGYYNTFYFNGQYVDEPYNGVHFLYLRDLSHQGVENANFDWNIASLILDEWVQEKIVVNLNGHVKYYMNGLFMGEKVFDVDPDLINAPRVYLDINPWGWWVGHYQYMDDFKITTPAVTISDNFDDGILDTNIWQTPVNPDGVREEDGIVKMEQLRTDKDFHLRSVAIPLR